MNTTHQHKRRAAAIEAAAEKQVCRAAEAAREIKFLLHGIEAIETALYTEAARAAEAATEAATEAAARAAEAAARKCGFLAAARAAEAATEAATEAAAEAAARMHAAALVTPEAEAAADYVHAAEKDLVEAETLLCGLRNIAATATTAEAAENAACALDHIDPYTQKIAGARYAAQLAHKRAITAAAKK